MDGSIDFVTTVRLTLTELAALDRVLSHYVETAVNVPDDDPAKGIQRDVRLLVQQARRQSEMREPQPQLLVETEPQVSEESVETEQPPSTGAVPPTAPTLSNETTPEPPAPPAPPAPPTLP